MTRNLMSTLVLLGAIFIQPNVPFEINRAAAQETKAPPKSIPLDTEIVGTTTTQKNSDDIDKSVTDRRERTTTGNTLAVLNFSNASPDVTALNPLCSGLAMAVTAELGSFQLYEIVEREQLKALITEQKISNSDMFDSSSSAKIGKLLGANYIVFGSFFSFLDTLRIDAKLVEVETGRIAATAGASGKAAEFSTLIKDVATTLSVTHAKRLQKAAPVAKASNKIAPSPIDALVKLGEIIELSEGGSVQEAMAALRSLAKTYPDLYPAQKLLNDWEKK